MAFPYTTYANFEAGTKGHFDTETDTNSGLDFPHYTDLAKIPGLSMPYRGAYCARINLATASTAGAWLQETGSWDCTVNTEDIYIRLKVWLSPDAAMANNDVFSLIELWSATNTAEGCVGIKYTTAAGWQIGIGDAAVPSVLASLTLGMWHDVEVYFNVADATNGTIDMWLDGTPLTQVTGITQATITSGIVGANPGAAFTPTAGTLLIDEVVASQTDNTSARIGMQPERFAEQQLLIASGHVFVGPGIIDNVTLLSGNGTDCVCTLYDTDMADTTNANVKLELKNLTANEIVDPAGMPVSVIHGCYLVLSGTSPRAMVQIRRASGYSSDGAIRNYAMRR